ncbi:oxygenase MpaB family protein [Dietzia sp. PP-33]|uniref:oxygenase MpaB family protein n=1 Tax=Dietzia sp. PP-33 TaxID=2957500 RepID=UPI0029A8098D|nr:oxygenase MpaB family protein [Dietzia sp. PP-33]MDX2359073.1 oxygenase MpaB family protein [Dietzia sp. PP-33]
MCSILDIPGPRWFHPGDPVWRVHGDAATPIGITTGLLMVTAHPAFAAALAAADAVENPWAADDYLHDLVEITTFGTVDDAMVTIENAHRDRCMLSGTTEHGEYYYGSDPELVEWAHAALTWALLAAFQRFTARPLTPAESDEYVRQSAGVAHLHGTRTSPTTVRELEQLLRSSRGRARATCAGRLAATRLRETARACKGVGGTSITAHRSCVTVVDAAASLVPSDVRRALDLPHRPMDRTAVFGRITRAHEGLGAPMLTTRAPIAVPSAMRSRPA